MPLIFQYGSNCDAERLNSPDRLNGHAQDLGRAETIEDYDIAFDVYSHGNHSAASDLVPTAGAGRKAWGVLYEIPDEFIRGKRTDGKKTLKGIEGSRYEERSIRVRDSAGTEHDAITFLVKEDERRIGLWARAEYVGHVVNGLRAHDVPEDYVQHVIDIAIETNDRAKQMAEQESRTIESLRTSENRHDP